MALHEWNDTWTNWSHLSFVNIRLFTTPLYFLVEELLIIPSQHSCFLLNCHLAIICFALQIGDTLQLTDRRFDSQQDTCCRDSIQIPGIYLLFQCNVVWEHFKCSRKSLNDWSDLSKSCRWRGWDEMCVFVCERVSRERWAPVFLTTSTTSLHLQT